MSDSLVHAVSGAAGGCVAMAVTYPLINVSTRAQVETKNNPNESTRHAVTKIIKREGFSGLYDGLSSSLLGIAVTNGIYYLFFEESRSILLKAKNNSKATLSTLESMLAGAIAGSATSIISNPIWVVNTRQTVRSTLIESDQEAPEGTSTKKVVVKKLGFLETVLQILKTDGPGAFFGGLGPALILVINPIIQYTLFEQMKNALVIRRALAINPKKGNTVATPPLSDIDYFILGALSKLIATGVTYPYLTVKSRMQAGQAEGKRYKSAWDGLQTIIKKEGFEGLYRGVGPKLAQSMLTAALLFASKERIYTVTKKALVNLAKSKVVKVA